MKNNRRYWIHTLGSLSCELPRTAYDRFAFGVGHTRRMPQLYEVQMSSVMAVMVGPNASASELPGICRALALRYSP